ncbi:MAG: ATP-binding cassette domain-containing protein [Clostridia bacterium]|nr:ATP-binding cassette domain-containing protein [Clostridia bacterium]
MSEACVVLQAEQIRMWFPVRNALGRVVNHVKAVEEVSLCLHAGETYGLVGESGCGKSTLGRVLVRLLEPTEGSVNLFGNDISHLKDKALLPFRRDIQMVFQDPYTSLDPRQRIGNMLMEVQQIHHIGRNRDERMARAMETLGQVGLLKEHFYRFPHEFSGGQRQRIGLARALILDPKVIICDEPVSALDVSIQSQIINLLRELQKKRQLRYVFISHDMSVIKYISDRVGVMYLGHLVEEADTEELFAHPVHPYTKTLMSAVPSIDTRNTGERIVLKGELPSPIDPPSGCVFHTRCPMATGACMTDPPALREISPGHWAACPICAVQSIGQANS